MKVLICGGRRYGVRMVTRRSDPAWVEDNARVTWETRIMYSVLDEWHARTPFSLLIHGASKGADNLAGSWAEKRGICVRKYPAEWQARGLLAGPIRNQKMLDHGKPDLVIAFPGGSGTADMVRRAAVARVRIEQVVL